MRNRRVERLPQLGTPHSAKSSVPGSPAKTAEKPHRLVTVLPTPAKRKTEVAANGCKDVAFRSRRASLPREADLKCLAAAAGTRHERRDERWMHSTVAELSGSHQQGESLPSIKNVQASERKVVSGKLTKMASKKASRFAPGND